MLGLLNYGFDDITELKFLWCGAWLKEYESHGTV
jgi:hypothetical protein